MQKHSQKTLKRGRGCCGRFEDYHALPKEEKMGGAQNGQAPPPGGALPAPPLCSPSASMADVAFLNTALAVYEPDLYARLSSCGFHCSMFFYKAFMRWYASVLPELTLFRFWDRLFYETTAKGPPLGKSNPNANTPPQRSVRQASAVAHYGPRLRFLIIFGKERLTDFDDAAEFACG